MPGGVPGGVEGAGLGVEVATTAACDAWGWGVVVVDSQGFAIAAPMASATTTAPTTAGSILRRPRSSRSGSNSTVTDLSWHGSWRGVSRSVGHPPAAIPAPDDPARHEPAQPEDPQAEHGGGGVTWRSAGDQRDRVARGDHKDDRDGEPDRALVSTLWCRDETSDEASADDDGDRQRHGTESEQVVYGTDDEDDGGRSQRDRGDRRGAPAAITSRCRGWTIARGRGG